MLTSIIRSSIIRTPRILLNNRRCVQIQSESRTLPLFTNTAKSSHSSIPLETQIRLQPPQSLQNRVISIQEPSDSPAPQWMLRYFPQFFEHQSDIGPEENGTPMGVSAVYGYLVSAGICAVLVCAIIYEKFFTNSEDMALAAMREKRVREEVRRLETDHLRNRMENEQLSEGSS